MRAPRTVALEHEYQILYQQAPSGGDPIFIPGAFSETRLPAYGILGSSRTLSREV